jgi:hypothetical protein
MFPTFVRNTWTATPPPAETFLTDAARAALPQACLTDLPVSLSRLLDLLDENGEDDYGQIGPSQFAFRTAFRMVQRAERVASGEFSSSPTVDSEGGIRISWRKGDRQVKLICPAKREAAAYIYRSSVEGSSVRNQNVTEVALAEALSWLSSSEPTTERTSG